VRYADDAVLLFESEADARRVYQALPSRFAEYGLKLHPSKTRLVEFRQPRYRDPKPPHVSFDFLGFTHYWGRSQKGGWIVKRKTAKDRMSRSLHAVRQWCRRHRHLPLAVQHKTLCSKVRGHYAFFGVTGNGQRLRGFLCEVEHAWQKWLNRRSRKAHMYWTRFERILKHYPLPPVRLPRSTYQPVANPRV
jgi:hypothetical protein